MLETTIEKNCRCTPLTSGENLKLQTDGCYLRQSVLDAEAPCTPEVMALASHIAFSRQGLESLRVT